MTPILTLLIGLLAISGIGLVALVLLHSGKGTGINEMIASSVHSSQTGTSIVEKNLDRLTVAAAVAFAAALVCLMVCYPSGSIA